MSNIKAYKVKNLKIHTYDGRTFTAECNKIFTEQSRKKIEDWLVNDAKNIIKGDIPTHATFTLVEI